MEHQAYFKILITLLLATACSTATYRVTTTPPDAEVEITLKSGLKRTLGKSPVIANAQETNPQHESFEIEVKKEGFEKKKLIVQDSYYNKNIELNLNLTPLEKNTESLNNQQALSEIASAVADIQKDIQTKSYEGASIKLTRMIALYPNVSTFHSLSGNVHYLERRLDKALGSYRKALALEPNSTELTKMVERLESLVGSKK